MIEKIDRYGVIGTIVDEKQEWIQGIGRTTKWISKLEIIDRKTGKKIIDIDTRDGEVNRHICDEVIRILNYEVVL